MADKVSIKGLGASLDSVLEKIELVGVSLAGLAEYGSLLEEVDRLTDEILSKKRELDSLGLSASTKTDLQNRLDGLAATFRAGGDTQQQFKGINRIGSLSGGINFSPAFQSRVDEAGKGLKQSGMAGGALKSLVLSDLRRLGLMSGGGSSASHGGMNAFMAMRITQLGDALMGVGAIASGRGEGTTALYKDKEEEAIDETLNIIRATSDEILDALGSRSSVSGSIQRSSAGSRIDIRSGSKGGGGFSWGGLLKTLGTVGLIGGAAFGALSSDTVQQWLADMQDPEKRKEWWEKVDKKIAELKKDLLAAWDAVSESIKKVAAVVSPVSGGDVREVAQAYAPVYKDLSPEYQTFVQNRVVVEEEKGAIEIAGLSDGQGWDALKNFVGDAGEVTLAGGATYLISKALLKGLFTGAKSVVLGSAAVSAGGVAAGVTGLAAVVGLMTYIGNKKKAFDIKAFNAVSAQAAYEAGRVTFPAFLGNTQTIGLVPFVRVADGNGGTFGDVFTEEEKLGMQVAQIAEEQAYLDVLQTDATLSQVGGVLQKRFKELQEGMGFGTLKDLEDLSNNEVITPMLGRETVALLDEYNKLKVLKNEFETTDWMSLPFEERKAFIQGLFSHGFLKEGDLQYSVIQKDMSKEATIPWGWYLNRYGKNVRSIPLSLDYFTPTVASVLDAQRMVEDGQLQDSRDATALKPGYNTSMVSGTAGLQLPDTAGWQLIWAGTRDGLNRIFGHKTDFVGEVEYRYSRPTGGSVPQAKAAVQLDHGVGAEGVRLDQEFAVRVAEKVAEMLNTSDFKYNSPTVINSNGTQVVVSSGSKSPGEQ